MADNYLPPINLDFGGLAVPTPADAGSEAMRRLKGDGTIPPGTPPEVVRMLDDTGGDPALDTPQVFSDKDPSQLKQTPDPTDPVGSPWYMPPPAAPVIPDWASRNLVPDINPEQLKRSSGQYDPTFLDKAAKALGLPSGIGRMSPSDAQAEQAQRQKELEDARKTVTDQILYPGSAALDGPPELFTVGKPAGLLEAGNLDLNRRPQVKNADGSISTVRSMSFGENGVEILVPTVSPDGRIMSDEEAIDYYHQTGQHLGKFKDGASANIYAEALHEQQAQGLTPKINQSVLDQNVSNAAPVKQKQKVADQALPELQKWRDFTERSVQSFLTGLVAIPRGAAIGFDLPRALGAWWRGNPDLDQNAVAEKLQQVTRDIERAIPGDPGRKDELVSQLGSGSGSFGSFLVGGAALKGLGISFKSATAMAGAAVGGTQQFDDARYHDATVAARYLSFMIGAGFGLTEAIPIDRALFWLNAKGGGVVSRVLATTAVSSLTEMGQEVVQQLGSNLTAKYLYDSSRDIFEGVADAGIVASVLGGVFGMGGHSVQAVSNKLAQSRPATARVSAPPQKPESQPAANVAQGQGVLTEAAGPLAGQTVEVQGPTGDGAGYHVKLEDGTETIMGRNAVELPPEVGLPAPAPAANSPQTAPVGDQTQTEEFRRWFGESKVVDEQGKPLALYHGTTGDFTAFDMSKAKRGAYGSGIYLSNDLELGRSYSDGGQPIEAYVSLKNPYVVDRSLPYEQVLEQNRVFRGQDARPVLEAQGYDGILIKEGSYREAIAFSPTQIKSATGNSGAFDGSNPDITASVAPRPMNFTPGGGMKTIKLGDTTIDYGVSSAGDTADIILVKTPKAKRGQGSARRALEQFLAETDQRGLTVFLTPEPMDDKPVSKGGLQKLYKSLGFVENTGKKKDFRSQAAMVREPKSDISAMQSPQLPRQSYPLERQRPAAGIPEQQALPTGEQSPSKRDITDRFKDAINLVVKQGRFGKANSKAEAIYKWGQSVARVKTEGQMLELFHEGGHHLHATLEPLLDPVITKHEAEIFKIADTLYGGGGVIKMSDIVTRRREGFATFFQVYMNNPAEARVIAPKFLPDFEALMEGNNPGIKKELDGIRQDVERWLLSKSSAQLARERVVSSKPLGTIGKIVESIKGGTVLHDIATLSNRVYQATLNDQHPITLAVRRLRTIAEENIRVQIERKLLDRKSALAALEAITRRGRADPVKMAALARNAYHASSEMIASGIAKYQGDGTAVSKGLTEILNKAAAKNGRVDEALYNDFNTYLAMRRIISEWRNYYATLQWDRAKSAGRDAKEPPVKRFRRPDDVSLGDAQQAVADLEKANPQFAEAAGDIYTYLDELLQYKVDAGLLTQEGADRQRQIADYVPLRREMDGSKSGTLGNSKDARTGKDNLVRVFRGSDRRILSPVESIMQMTHETVALVAKNDVKKGLVQMALDVGRGSGAVVEQIPASTMKGTSVRLADVLKAAGDFSLADEIAQAMGRDEITMQEFMDEVLDGDEVGTIWKKADITEKGDPIIYAWRNGEIEAYQLNEPEWADQLYSALTELGKEQTNLAIQILGAPAAALRAGVTSAPPFMIANLVRDQLSAWVLNDGVYPGVALGKGLASDLFDRKARRLYNLSMASIGGSNIAALDKTRFGTEQTMLAKAGIGLTAESALTTALRVVESTETFTRQGIWQSAYKKARADGLSEADAMIEAGFEASDYANYGRAGSKMLLARRLITFLNANLQGLDKSLRVALGGEGGAAYLRKELAPWVRRQLSPAAAARLGLEGSQTSLPLTAQEKAALARGGRTLSKMMMLAIPSALLAMLYWDDEEYQDFSPYMKGTRWMIKIAPGKWLAVPKPFQLASLATFVEYSIDAVLRGDPTAMQKFMQSQAGVIAPPYENPAIKQFYELATNTDMFSGRPIVTPSVAARPNWLQYDEYTSELGKAIGRWTGASPMIVDHVITGSFATWGRGFLSASNLFNPSRPSQGLDDFAFTSYFVKDGSRSSTVRPAFLDLVGQQQGALTGAYSGYRELMDSGAEGQARELLDNFTDDQKVFAQLYYHQKADAKKLHPLRNAYDIAQTISDLRKELVVNRVKQGGKEDGEILTVSPTQQKLLNDRLSDLQVRVQRNALVVTGQPGFANRRILPTFPIIEEIKAIDPRIAADLKLRMGSRIYTTDVVAQMWPRVKAEILAKGPKANLAPFVAKAKAAGTKIWTDGDTVQ